MNRKSLVVGLLGLVCFLVFLRISSGQEGYRREWKMFRVADEDAENPVARARQEWMQLRDPLTNEIPSGIRSRELAYAASLPSAETFAGSSLQKGQLLSWSARGPVNQGGRTRALAFDISDATGNTILAGGVSGGLWRSTNGGTTWTRTSSLSDSVQSVTCLVQDPRFGNQNNWYYGTGEYLGNSASGGKAFYVGDGIYKSTNNSISWQKLTNTASWTPQVFDRVSDIVWDVVVDPTNGNVYAALYGEIIRSTDGGATWALSLASTTGSTFSTFTDVAVTSSGVFYAVLSSDGQTPGVYRSTTGASGSWTNITPAGWPSTYDRFVIAIAQTSESNVYFLGDTPGSGYHDAASGDYTSFWKYTYVSGTGTGAGGTWVDRSANLPNFGGRKGNFSHQGGYDLVVKTKPNNPNFVFVGGTNIYRSTDGFATTTNTAWIGGYDTTNDVSLYPNQHCDEHAMVFMPGNPGTMLSGSDGGISKTTNDSVKGVSWTSLNNGYTTSQFYSVAIDQATAGDPTIVGGMQDNGNMVTTSTSGAQPWVVMPAGGDGCISAVANGRTFYYIGTQLGNILRLSVQPSYSTSYNWTVVKPIGSSGYLFVTPYALDPNNSNIMYLAAGNQVWRNSNLSGIANFQDSTSTNWTALSKTALSGHNVTAIGVSTNPTNRIYYGSDSTQVFRLDNANAATGTTVPTAVTGTNFPAGAYVSCIAVNPRNADTAIVVFSNYNVLSLFLTTNGGTSWSSVGGNLDQNSNGPSCRWVTILPIGSGYQYYVATSTGVYSTNSLNGAATVWALEGATQIGNVVTTMVVSRGSDSLVVAATHGNGVFSTKWISATAVQRATDVTPRNFSLSQNYPNPFNPSTTIQYDVPRTGSVTLTVFDVTGRRVATLFEGTRVAGSYTALWDGRSSDHSQVASGIYFYRIEAAGLTATRKMLMLK